MTLPSGFSDRRISCTVELNGADYRIDFAKPGVFAEWFAGLSWLLAKSASPAARFYVKSMDTILVNE